ncbi:MAG: UDP-N-acetyl-D-mannosamine dehydrogenase [Dehalococcoidia bacterium]|nr:UDP-N-acetyl-D-mannosamine dehydrogenase [Dehalococcoidia bacterium]
MATSLSVLSPARQREEADVCVLGLGYIGLPTASLLATHGLAVHGVDVSERVVESVNAARVHFVEPDLDGMVRAAVHSGNLQAGSRPVPADVFIIAVPTPVRAGHAPDLSYVDAAAEALVPVLRPGNLVILESTSPPGTTERIAATVGRARPDLAPNSAEGISGEGVSGQGDSAGGDSRAYFAHCPERVLPGRILVELVENDRIVGGLDDEATERAAAFYERFVTGEVLRTTARTAEMAKLAENSYRDLNIAFANELSVLAHDQGVDVWDLIELANHHPRVDILKPGPGVGGHCIAVDPWFLVAASPERTPLIRAVRKVNDAKPGWVIEQVHAALRERPDAVVASLGLAYKADVDDLRESPALRIASELRNQLGARALACDPLVPGLEYPPLSTLDEVLQRADVIVGLVGHECFREIAPADLAGRHVIDTCGMFRR